MPATITRIATIQRSLRELGRIRLGDKGPKGEPRKLKTFRLTSASRDYMDVAAEAYGGTVTDWESPRGHEYQITIVSPFLDVLVPPGDAFYSAYELWSGGGCQRRCDGITQETGEGCACPTDTDERVALAAKGQACKPTSRLWVILPLLPDLGRWRLEAHGYYAASELAGVAEIASMATSRGIMLPARLRIDERRRKIPGKPPRNYIVPVLELPETNFGHLVAAGHIATTNGQLEAGTPPARAQLAAGKPSRVERPALGAPPALPSEAAFERAAAPAFGQAPEPVAGGWPVEPPEEDDAAEAPPATADSAAPPATEAAGPLCGWKLGRGRGQSTLPCELAEMHAGEHSWHELALREGGRVIRPE